MVLLTGTTTRSKTPDEIALSDWRLSTRYINQYGSTPATSK